MPLLMLDYQRKAPAANRAGMGLLLAAIVGLSVLGAEYGEVAAALDQETMAAGALERAATRGGGTAPGRRAQEQATGRAADIAQANRVLRELGIPWGALFWAIEEAGGKDVTLLGLAPDAEKHVVKIAGEARNISAALAYLQRLQRVPALRDVHMQHHQVEEQDPDRPVRFTVFAAWEAQP